MVYNGILLTKALRFVSSTLTSASVSMIPPTTAPKSRFTRPVTGTFAAATSAAISWHMLR